MSISTTITCDCGCGAVKQGANHWWLVIAGAGGFAVYTWSDELLDGYLHAHGRECVNRMLDKWMSEQAGKAAA